MTVNAIATKAVIAGFSILVLFSVAESIPAQQSIPFTEIGLNGSALAGLTPGPDGRLYGVTYDGPVSDDNNPTGPRYDEGTIYSVDRNLTNRVDHHTFIAATDGATPSYELTFNPDNGKFYGTTSDGGQTGPGTIFTFDPVTNDFYATPWSYTGLVAGSLVVSNGFIYGTVQSYPEECIFRLSPDLTTTMFLQCVPWGASLQGLTLGDDGWLYGNALYGGINGEIFKIRPLLPTDPFDPQYQTIFQFQFYGGVGYACPPDDKFCVQFPYIQNNPVQQLEYGSDGYLYGSTFYSVFRLDPHAPDVTASFRTLWNDGGGVQVTVIEGLDGRLYFTDYGGGTEGVGRILSMYKSGAGVFELRNFTLLSGSTANGPYGRLFHDPITGKIFGTTEYTNVTPYPGTAFAIDIPPAEYRLAGSQDGTAPLVVDDALDIYVNGNLFYTDGTAGSGERGPIEIPEGFFDPGDIVRLVVRDTYGVCASLSPVYLVDNFGTSTLVDDGFSLGCGLPAGNNGVVYDESFTVPSVIDNTLPGNNVAVVARAGDASVTFSSVGTSGNTTFTPIDPNTAGAPPDGFTLCPTCPAYDVTTTAAYTPPVTVCLDVPAGIDGATFSTMALLHGVNGVLVDVTTERITNMDGTREICGVVTSLSPFALAFGNSAPTLSNVAATGPITEGGSTTLSGNISDANSGDAFTLTVDWGDGSAPQPFSYLAGTTSFSETHQYADNPAGQPNGGYTVSVLLDDSNGGSDTDSASVAVNNAEPMLSNVSATPSTIIVGSSTTVSATVADAGTLDTFAVLINWGDNSTPTQFSPGAGSFARDHQYTVAGQYSVDITVTDDDGGEATSNVLITVNPAPSLPAAPANLMATANSTEQITLGWADNSDNEEGFRIERCTRKNCTNFVQIAEVAADATSFQNIGLTKGTQYRYRVRAFNADGGSAYSNIASAKTLRR